MNTVVDLVSADVSAAIGRLTTREAQFAPPADTSWADGIPVTQPDRGYVQDLDSEALAEWAAVPLPAGTMNTAAVALRICAAESAP